MKKQKMSKKIWTSLACCSILPLSMIPILRNDYQSSKSTSNYNYEYFNNLIKTQYKNNVPGLIIGRDAAIQQQQGTLLTVGEALLQKQDSINNVADYNFFYLPHDSFTRMNVNGFGELKNSDYEINNFTQSNLKPINLFTRDNPNAHYEYQWSNLKNDIDKIKALTNSELIDLSIDEYLFKEIIVDALKNPVNSTFEYLVQNCNQIIVLTDGAAHTVNIVPFNIEILNDNVLDKPSAVSSLNQVMNKTKSITPKDIKDFIQLNDFTINGRHYDDFIHFIHYDSRYITNLNDLYNVTSFDLNFYDYKSLFQNQTIANEFINIQSNVFAKGFNTFKDIFVSGHENYDPNKKNVIFIGSSLFIHLKDVDQTSRLESFDNVRKEIQDQFQIFLKKFPPEKYNIMFKLHPAFKNEKASEYVEIITNKSIKNPIIISPSIPFEILLSNDYTSYKNNTGLNFIFRGKNKEEVMNNTKYFGFQATTSSIHTTRLFYEKTFGISSKQASELISFNNFPIPTLFPIVARIDKDSYERKYYDQNVAKLNDIYKYYNPSVLKNDPNLKDKDLFYLNNLVPMNSDFQETESKNDDKQWIYITVGVVCSVVVIAAIVLTIVLVMKKKKNANKTE